MNDDIKSEREKLSDEYLAKVPQELRDAITSFDWKSKVIEIGQKNKLHIDQIDDLVAYTGLALSGMMSAEQYRGELEDELVLTEGQDLDEIIRGINNEVFMRVRDALVAKTQKKSDDNEALAAHIGQFQGVYKPGAIPNSPNTIPKSGGGDPYHEPIN